MSQYDLINVSGNKFGIPYVRPHHLFKTKNLGGNDRIYQIDSNNQLIESIYHHFPVKNGVLPPTGPVRYVGQMEIYLEVFIEFAKWETHTYILTFEDFKIVKAELKISPEPYIREGTLYDPVRMTATPIAGD